MLTRLLIFSMALNLAMGLALMGDPRQVWNFQEFCYREMMFMYMRGCIRGTRRDPKKFSGIRGWDINSPSFYCNENADEVREQAIESVNKMGKQ